MDRKPIDKRDAKGKKYSINFFFLRFDALLCQQKWKGSICDFIIIFSIVLDFICTYCLLVWACYQRRKAQTTESCQWSSISRTNPAIRSSSGVPDCLLDEPDVHSRNAPWRKSVFPLRSVKLSSIFHIYCLMSQRQKFTLISNYPRFSFNCHPLYIFCAVI